MKKSSEEIVHFAFVASLILYAVFTTFVIYTTAPSEKEICVRAELGGLYDGAIFICDNEVRVYMKHGAIFVYEMVDVR